MRILIADPDRDFLESFSGLLGAEGHDIQTVFDGTQVISAVSDRETDLVILSRDIPRLTFREITATLNEMDIPVIIVLGNKPGADMLLDKDLAQTYLRLPFFPDELKTRIREITEKRSGKKILQYKDIEMDTAKFMIVPDVRVTNEEINIFSTLITEGKLNEKNVQPYITALNNKFASLGKKTFIRYIMNEGYRLVSSYE